MGADREILHVAGREVVITNPGKVFFPEGGRTKLDLVRYYLAVAEGALRGVGDRPMALKRYVNGITGEAFYQKRVSNSRPDWIDAVELRFPSGRTAEEVVVRDAAQLAWVVNLGCVDLHPHPVRAGDLAHPDELRVDLDPVPGVPWSQVRDVALVVREVLHDAGLTGWPKTSGSRGMHVYCRIQPRWTFRQVRDAAQALAREVQRRAPDLATSAWWKEERHGVFIDFNQMAKDRTTVSAYSVRPTPDARVSTPLEWAEVPGCDPAEFTVDTVPARFAVRGDPWAGLDGAVGSLDGLLDLVSAQQAADREAGAAGRAGPDAGAAGRAGTAAGPGAGRGGTAGGGGRRRSTMPLIEVARTAHRDDGLAALDRWKARHPDVVPYLEPADILVDSMRGRSSTWTRIRINLRHVPTGIRPAQEPLEEDYNPWAGLDGTQG